MSFQSTALLLAWVAIALLALAVSGLIRQLRSVGLPTNRFLPTSIVGGLAPPLGDGSADWPKPTILLFVSAECRVCQDRLNELDAIVETA
jgi:hypothetical protein